MHTLSFINTETQEMNPLTPINYQTLFEHVPGLYVIILEDFTIAEVSKAYTEATFTKREEIIGRNLFEVFPDNPNDLTADGVANLKESLKYVFRNKVSHTMAIQKHDVRKPDGAFDERYWSTVNKPVLNDRNEIEYVIHRAEDVTEFIKLKQEKHQFELVSNAMEDRLQKMEIEIIQRTKEVQKLNQELDIKVLERTRHLDEANSIIQENINALTFQKKQLEDFCNIISHNLRAPLVNISMIIEMLAENSNDIEKGVLLEKLNSTTRNLSEIFNELVESIQILQDNEIESEEIDLALQVQKVTDSLQIEIERSGAVIETYFKEAPQVYFPLNYIKSILQNLISNSLKYRSTERSPMITVRTERKDDTVILSIADNGLGLDLEKHKHDLFKIRKIFHTHPEAKGFGLFLTKSQVEAMGGKIWIESTPGIGSTFYIQLINQNR
jgi:PAS domain S-box-containing protein